MVPKPLHVVGCTTVIFEIPNSGGSVISTPVVDEMHPPSVFILMK
jgi:hypothetical protein